MIEAWLLPGEQVRERGRPRWPPLKKSVAIGLAALAIHGAIAAQRLSALCGGSQDREVVVGVFTVSAIAFTGPVPADLREYELHEFRTRSRWSGSAYGSTGAASWSFQAGWVATPAWLVPVLVVSFFLKVLIWRRREVVVTSLGRAVAVDRTNRWVGQGDGARAREVVATTHGLFWTPEVDEVLAPGEKLLWEGRAVGHPGRFWVAVALVLAIAAYSGIVACLLHDSVKKYTTSSYSVDVWSVHATGSATLTDSTGKVIGTSSGSMACPLPSFLVLGALVIELARLAAWRARRYAVTDKRVLGIGLRGKLLGNVPLPSSAAIKRGVLVVGNLRLLGIADPEAARSAMTGRSSG